MPQWMEYGIDQDTLYNYSSSDEFEDAFDDMTEAGRRLPPLRRFDGIVPSGNKYSADEWWEDFAVYLRLNNITELDNIKDWLMMHLEGTARSWYSGHTDHFTSWEQVDLFFNAFRPPNIEQTLAAEFTSLKQGKASVLDYFNRFNTLRSRCHGLLELEERAALGMFRQGLRRELAAQAACAPGVGSVEELLPVLVDYENDTGTEDRGNQRGHGTNRLNRFPNRYSNRANNFADPARVNVPRHESRQTTDADGDVTMRLMSLSPQERQRRLKERRCFSCGSQDHFQRDCGASVHVVEKREPESPQEN